MNISIFGLGYVGTVSAACLAIHEHNVIGVDLNTTKVEIINRGMSPIVEKDLAEMIDKAVHEQRLFATTDANQAIEKSEISFICVGTPSLPNGNLDLTYVQQTCEQIGLALKKKTHRHIIIVRSTMLPGSMRDVVIPTLEKFSDKKVGKDFGLCINPEFLREGSAVSDYYSPPKTVIGVYDPESAEILKRIYRNIDAPLICTNLETAEILKYIDNSWHALKVAFANEVGRLCKELNIDGYEAMEFFCLDTKLNLSPNYMKPGFSFGGSCLPKDIRALTYKATSLDLDLPILRSILPSNRIHLEKAIKTIIGKGSKRVGILGFAFKAGTDDLREAPMIDVIEFLIGKGFDLKLYDRNVHIASLTGANRDYIMDRISHISRLMTDTVEEVVNFADVIVVGNNSPEFQNVKLKLRPGQYLIDFIHISSQPSEHYEGLCW